MATAKQFLDAIELQKLVPPALLDELYEEYRGSGGSVTAESMAKRLVASGSISQDKANLLLQSPSDSFVQVTAASLSSGSLSSSGVLSASSVNLGQEQPPTDPFDDELEKKKTKSGEKRDETGRRKHVKKTHKNDFDSPLLLIGGGVLAMLLLGGVGLTLLMGLQSGDQLLESAREAYESGSLSSARDQYEAFVEDFGSHTRWSEARVSLAVVRIRQLTDTSGDWLRALAVAQEEIPQIEDEEAFPQRRGEFASMLPKIARGLAEKAESKSESSDGTDEALTAEIDEMVAATRDTLALIGNTKYVPKSQRDSGDIADIEALLDRVARRREAVADLAEALKQIDASAGTGDIATAYATHSAFVSRRPELRDDERLAERLAAAVESERQTVRYVEDPADAATEDRPSAIGLALPLANPRREGRVEASGVFVSAFRGVLYAVDASTGELRWRRPIGESLDNVSPTQVGDDLLVIDHRRGVLLRLDAASGKLAWRVQVEEPDGDSSLHTPVPAGDRILVASESGRLWSIGATDGKRYGYAQFAQPLRSPPAADPEHGKAYLLGQQSSLYSLDAQTLECLAVQYNGHAKGAAPVAPIALAGRVLLLQNVGAETSLLTVYGTNADGMLANKLSEWRQVGVVSTNPVIDGRRVLVTTERDAAYLYEVSDGPEAPPLSQIATRAAQRQTGGQSRVAAVGGEVWVAGEGLTRTAASLADSQLVVRAIPDPCDKDRFLGSFEARGGALLHTRVRKGAPGVTFGATDARSGKLVWETDLSVAPLGPPIASSRPRGVIATTILGHTHLIGPAQIKAGVSPKPTVAPPGDRGYNARIALASGIGVLSVQGTREWIATALAPRVGVRLSSLPGDLAAVPTALAGALVAPLSVGQVHLLDAAGRQRATPFQPKVNVGESVEWTRAAVGKAGAQRIVAISDGARSVYCLGLRTEGDPALVELGSHELTEGDPTTPVEIAESRAAIGLAGGRLVILELPALGAAAVVDLPSEIVSGPHGVGDRFVVGLDDGRVAVVDPSGSVAWTAPLDNSRLAGPPLADGDAMIVVTQGGTLMRLDAGSGEALGREDLGQRAGSGATAFGSRLLVAAADGTVLVLSKP